MEALCGFGDKKNTNHYLFSSISVYSLISFLKFKFFVCSFIENGDIGRIPHAAFAECSVTAYCRHVGVTLQVAAAAP